MTNHDLADYPLLNASLNHVGVWPNLRTAVEGLLEAHGVGYATMAEAQLSTLKGALESRNSTLEDALDGYVEMTIDTLRLQAEYFRTGRFSYLDESPGDELHQDEELMLGRYLPGLFLASVFWPNHRDKLEFFNETYLPMVADGAKVLDVGTGPGSYGFLCADAGADVLFNDLSPHSKKFVESMATTEVRFLVGSFLDIDPGQQNFDGIIFSEVVEHLPEPVAGMKKLRALCSDRAAVFFSTATNAAFYDHTIIFETVDEIRSMIADHDLRVVAEQEVVATNGPDGRDVIDYNAVLTIA